MICKWNFCSRYFQAKLNLDKINAMNMRTRCSIDFSLRISAEEVREWLLLLYETFLKFLYWIMFSVTFFNFLLIENQFSPTFTWTASYYIYISIALFFHSMRVSNLVLVVFIANFEHVSYLVLVCMFNR